MAAMTTALTEFSNNGNTTTYTLAGHTVSDSEILIQSRKVPSGNQTVATDVVKLVKATRDDAGLLLPSPVVFEVHCRRPISGQSADIATLLAYLRDVVAGDEFANTVDSQERLG